MAAKNSVKEFVAGGVYHIYNRGVEKRLIFLDEQDYAVFLSYLKTYLLPKDECVLRKIIADPEKSSKEKDKAVKSLRLNNFSETLTLVAYCLMPNHFHLLVRQVEADIIDRFMNSLGTRYATYFNHKYHRVGPLFQGIYKAVLVGSDEQLVNLTRYIHRNPISIASQDTLLRNYAYSSYAQYLGLSRAQWCHPEDILGYFSKSQKRGYQSFVEGPADDAGTSLIGTLILDEDDA